MAGQQHPFIFIFTNSKVFLFFIFMCGSLPCVCYVFYCVNFVIEFSA